MPFDESETQTPSIAVEIAPASAQKHLTPNFSHQEQEPAAPAMGELTTDGTASLRLKLKNKVHDALASMKSSSNLKDRVRTLHPESAESPLKVQDQNGDNGERRHSVLVLLSSDASAQQALKWDNSNHAVDDLTVSPKHRHSKNFWTFPRVRHDAGQTSTRRHQPSWEAEDNDDSKLEDALDAIIQPPSTRVPAETEDGSTTLYHQMQELKVDEFDSDKSLDIILPADYEDYTMFAEFPLKKRKKMERSLAAAASDSHRRSSSMKASAEAMKRFLKKQESRNKDVSTEDSTAIEVLDQEVSAVNSNKKRPQAVPEIAEGSSKRSGQLAADWRRSLLKSLHLNKGVNTSRKGANNDGTTNRVHLDALTEDLQAAAEARRNSTSNSVHTTRSMSLTTSTHPALLATAISKPRSPGLRRETLEMAMRRRRQSGATVRLNIGEDEVPPPLPQSSEFFGVDNISTTNITHTFTSFTLELAEMHARDVINNSAIPGLFNFKRRTPRLTVSSNMMELDTDHDFKGFDSDGDAISGYTGDADISMDEIHVRPPKASVVAPSFKTRAREFSSGAAGLAARRKISSIDGDSDTVPELPKLLIRTRDLNLRGSGHVRGNSGSYSRLGRPLSGSSFDMELDSQLNNGVDNGPRSPQRSGQISPPALTRMSGRGISTSPTSARGPSSPVKLGRTPLSIEEIASWEPRDADFQPPRPSVPMLDIRPLKPTRGVGGALSTTLISASRTPNSASTLTQSPVMMTPTGERVFSGRSHYHQQSTSSSSTASQHHEHQHQMSGDTLVPSHLRYVSSGSVMSARSGYSVHTLGAREFDPSEEFPPTTPADLKAMDFEALLEAAEREQSKGWEDLMAQKKGFEDHLATPANTPPAKTMSSLDRSTLARSTPFPLPPTVAPLKIVPSTRNNRSNQQYQPLKQLSQLQQQQQRTAVAFDIAPSNGGPSGTVTGTADRSMRTRRVMKKKMSVIRLAGSGYGNVQGRREDDEAL
ncbi:hypothetical protein BGX34_008681 [Mortierella sp. NVP85]|nr:hypothetical protein BGX34_008681 [Mortierella sp. NVP85]